MVRALVVLGLVVSVLLAFKDGVILKDVGLISRCDSVTTPAGFTGEWRAGFTGEWRACRSGALDGWPDLSPRGCTRQGVIAGVAYWTCPSERESGASARPG